MKTLPRKLLVDRESLLLRAQAEPVLPEAINSQKIKTVIDKMKQALHAEDDGVAIAAPQIGESLRIFIVKDDAIAMAKGRTQKEKPQDLVFINPTIVKVSKKKRKMEEGCLSLRYLYGEVLRHEKITITAFDEKGREITASASGLLSQIFQHEIDHLEGILFTDKAENVRDLPPANDKTKKINYVFFGSSRFSEFVLDELERAGHVPMRKITSAREPLPPLDELRALNADIFVVASFGKILPQELLDIPRHGSLNVHPSLLPELRGPAPIQGLILGQPGNAGAPTPGITIIKMDKEMDHGPIVAQEKVGVTPWPDYYAIVEEKLARAGGQMLARVMPSWIGGEITPIEQDHRRATYIKMIKKEDGLLDLTAPAEINWRKVLAYSTWPGAYLLFKRKTGDEIRVVVKSGKIENRQFIPTRVIPAGKREMVWEDFLRGNA